MDSIDVLGDQYNAYSLLNHDLLAETDDSELQLIVENAAAELDSPIALVSLILDQIQFFKAHVGLPEVLAKARGTHRDVSFCQFVVESGQPFEVNDGLNDPRIPQHVVEEFNIQSYLGVPIKLEDHVVGSLCVLDTKKRKFTNNERDSLQNLASLVNKRLEEITKQRKQVRLALSYTSLHPALKEISETLQPIQDHITQAYANIASIRSFLKLSKHLFADKNLFTPTAKKSFEAASMSIRMIQDQFTEIEMSVLDSVDCLDALNKLVTGNQFTNLSGVLAASQDLTRNATKAVGGFSIPDFESDPVIYTKADLAIALVSNSLLLISAELLQKNAENGIKAEIKLSDNEIILLFSSQELKSDIYTSLAEQLNILIGTKHPSISIHTQEKSIALAFKTREYKGRDAS